MNEAGLYQKDSQYEFWLGRDVVCFAKVETLYLHFYRISISFTSFPRDRHSTRRTGL